MICDPLKVLVYLPFEDIPAVVSTLRDAGKGHFYCYASVQEARDEGNIHLRTFSRHNFINDLKTCSGVIANAGFTLTSETLYLGKKLLVKPLAGQLEQTSNALALQQLNMGMVMQRLGLHGWCGTGYLFLVQSPLTTLTLPARLQIGLARVSGTPIGDLAAKVWGMVTIALKRK